MRHTDVNEVKAAAEAAAGLRQLNERSREIFKRIVETYLATGEPVGSRNLSRALPMTLSPASVRNVMSDLEGLGLIYAPHTSAGRLPTHTGLRLFIDGLLEIGDISVEERGQIESRIAGSGRRRAIEVLVGEDGDVENRIVALPDNLPLASLHEASNYINARIGGLTLAEARIRIER